MDWDSGKYFEKLHLRASGYNQQAPISPKNYGGDIWCEEKTGRQTDSYKATKNSESQELGKITMDVEIYVIALLFLFLTIAK